MHRWIKNEDKMQFFHHLTTLFSAGTPLLEALQIASHQTQSRRMKDVILQVTNKVSAGNSLNQALSDFPKIFETQWVEIIKTGELSGQLTQVLTALGEHIKESKELHTKVVSAMIYPIIMCVVAVAAVVIMLWKVVPVFTAFFEDFGSKLPPITQVVVDTSAFLQQRGLMMLGCIAVGVFLARMYFKTKKGKSLLDRALLSVPMIGELIVYANMEKFATNMVLLLENGLPMMETLGSLKGVFTNSVYQEVIDEIQHKVSGGSGLTVPMEESGLFTSMLVSMVKIGEESGELVKVLREVAVYYRDRLKEIVERVVVCIEPVVIVGMGVSVAVILTSIYLPMFQMASGVK
ncbi:MAG: type II secretion system F family protein [Sedimentisphaerales bacterium]|nr:type II secretion system F family protein [Sedimentisphaerales bacterium]